MESTNETTPFGQPVLFPAAITVQAGAPLQTFTLARVSSQRYQPADSPSLALDATPGSKVTVIDPLIECFRRDSDVVVLSRATL